MKSVQRKAKAGDIRANGWRQRRKSCPNRGGVTIRRSGAAR